MRPALSVIFFTVSSGAGLGLLFWMVLLDTMTIGGGVPANAMLPMLALGMGLTSAGLLSSTLHLANPKNAWRAFSQFRTSWLSREGVLALALYPVALLYAVLLSDGASVARSAVGFLLALLALAVLFCTGMIYACLKTIPRWHTRLVPAAYVSLGIYSGALLTLPFISYHGASVQGQSMIVMMLLLLGLSIKLIYYFRFKTPDVQHTINDAIPLGKKSIKLLDVGHTHGTFLTDEFCFALARGHARFLRGIALGLGFALPLLALGAGSAGTLTFACAGFACLLGFLAERWLFFAEAQHVVRLYHGARRV